MHSSTHYGYIYALFIHPYIIHTYLHYTYIYESFIHYINYILHYALYPTYLIIQISRQAFCQELFCLL